MKTLAGIFMFVLFFAAGALAQTTNDLSEAEIQGRALAQQILEQQPAGNSTNAGILQIHDGNGNRTNYPIKFEIFVTATNWQSLYDSTQIAKPGLPPFVYSLLITHSYAKPNEYVAFVDCGLGTAIANDQTTEPFRHSDFWLCDFGLEFFHWPGQKVLKKDVHRSRGCTVLESTNPSPGTNGYSRVVSWVDNETLGIVEANAYDAKGRLLKDFYPKDFKKVKGQWQVQTLVMENVQTHSRSRLEFDLTNE